MGLREVFVEGVALGFLQKGIALLETPILRLLSSALQGGEAWLLRLKRDARNSDSGNPMKGR